MGGAYGLRALNK
jgi:ABC-type uncharacterized transport system fused permease/ATPase subunit